MPTNWENPYGESPEHAEFLREVAYACREEDVEKVEVAVETAVQGGEHGVLLIYRDGRVSEVRPDPSVPYGFIHEYADVPEGWSP